MKEGFLLSALALVFSAGCGGPVLTACGESTDPVVVTGLSGVLDDGRPAIEIVQLVPSTCEETDQRTWMLFEDPGAIVTLGPEPAGVLRRAGVEATDETIFFRDQNVGARLVYAEDLIGPDLDLVWFSSGVDLATVRCVADPFVCELVE